MTAHDVLLLSRKLLLYAVPQRGVSTDDEIPVIARYTKLHDIIWCVVCLYAMGQHQNTRRFINLIFSSSSSSSLIGFYTHTIIFMHHQRCWLTDCICSYARMGAVYRKREVRLIIFYIYVHVLLFFFFCWMEYGINPPKFIPLSRWMNECARALHVISKPSRVRDGSTHHHHLYTLTSSSSSNIIVIYNQQSKTISWNTNGRESVAIRIFMWII